MYHPGAVSRALLFALLLSLTASPAVWADGVIEINQARALAGSVNGDPVLDTPGFPVTITEPGSYRLTGNLVVADAAQIVVFIRTSDVELDLAGFTISGPTTCEGTPVTSCAPMGGGSGVAVEFTGAISNVTVRNGTVRGMGNHGLDLPVRDARVEGVSVHENGVVGMLVGQPSEEGATVVGCKAGRNGVDGLQVRGFGGLVRGNTSQGNGDDGIVVGRAGAGGNNLVTENVSRNNAGWGFRLGGGQSVLFTRNVAGNNLGDIHGDPKILTHGDGSEADSACESPTCEPCGDGACNPPNTAVNCPEDCP